MRKSSFYRRPDDPTTDFDVRHLRRVHDASGAPKPAQQPKPAAPASTEPGSTADETRWKPHRRADPVDIVLPNTRRWAEGLPEVARPDALMRAYPRIANHLAACWDQPHECRAYLYSLLVDTRGGRRGFPRDVQSDLLALREYFEEGARTALGPAFRR